MKKILDMWKMLGKPIYVGDRLISDFSMMFAIVDP